MNKAREFFQQLESSINTYPSDGCYLEGRKDGLSSGLSIFRKKLPEILLDFMEWVNTPPEDEPLFFDSDKEGIAMYLKGKVTDE